MAHVSVFICKPYENTMNLHLYLFWPEEALQSCGEKKEVH